jgi:hypothetical protein
MDREISRLNETRRISCNEWVKEGKKKKKQKKNEEKSKKGEIHFLYAWHCRHAMRR